MYKEVLRGMMVLAMCILLLLATRLQDICLRILLEVQR
jgi:hypothetical protein